MGKWPELPTVLQERPPGARQAFLDSLQALARKQGVGGEEEGKKRWRHEDLVNKDLLRRRAHASYRSKDSVKSTMKKMKKWGMDEHGEGHDPCGPRHVPRKVSSLNVYEKFAQGGATFHETTVT